MRAKSIVRKICSECEHQVHALRFAAVITFVEALLRTDRLSLTALGRSLPGCPKHQVKRADYMLGNSRLQRELPIWYGTLSRFLVGTIARPVILIDWTQVVGDFYALSATIPFAGRSLPLYHEVHPLRRYGSRRVQTRFLEQLRTILPEDCHPIIVADAGFRSPFFLACRTNGFDYVIRLRGKAKLWRRNAESTEARALKHVFASATSKPQCLGEWTPFDSARGGIHARIVMSARPRRRDSHRGTRSLVYRKSAREPWVLATSLTTLTANQVVAIYATRMKIEETFRDLKNPRFGWALSYSASRSAQRYSVLLLLASLALVAIILAGAAAEASDIRFRYQANTIMSRRVLSLFSLGRLIIRDAPSSISSRDILRQLHAVAAFVDGLIPTRKRHLRYGFTAAHAIACPHCGRGWIR